MERGEGRLAGRSAVVTGASSGIGRGIALALAAEGARVAAVARRAGALEETAALAPAGAPPLLVHAADLTRDDEMDGLAARLASALAPLDALVLSSGAISHGRLEEAPVEELDALWRANVRAHYRLTRLLLPLLAPARGQVVFVNSTVGLRARATVGAFAATQHAVRALAEALREEVEPRGLRVVSLYPGRTATPRQEGIFRHEGRPYRPELLMQPADVAALVVAALALPPGTALREARLRPMLKSY